MTTANKVTLNHSTPTTIIAANGSRKALYIYSNGPGLGTNSGGGQIGTPEVVYLALDPSSSPTAALNKGPRLAPVGGEWRTVLTASGACWLGAVSGICANAYCGVAVVSYQEIT